MKKTCITLGITRAAWTAKVNCDCVPTSVWQWGTEPSQSTQLTIDSVNSWCSKFIADMSSGSNTATGCNQSPLTKWISSCSDCGLNSSTDTDCSSICCSQGLIHVAMISWSPKPYCSEYTIADSAPIWFAHTRRIQRFVGGSRCLLGQWGFDSCPVPNKIYQI